MIKFLPYLSLLSLSVCTRMSMSCLSFESCVVESVRPEVSIASWSSLSLGVGSSGDTGPSRGALSSSWSAHSSWPRSYVSQNFALWPCWPHWLHTIRRPCLQESVTWLDSPQYQQYCWLDVAALLTHCALGCLWRRRLTVCQSSCFCWLGASWSLWSVSKLRLGFLVLCFLQTFIFGSLISLRFLASRLLPLLDRCRPSARR